MGGGGGDGVKRRELLRHEDGDLAHRLSVQHDGKVVAARHQVKAVDLGVVVDLFGDRVVAAVALGDDLQLNERVDVLGVGLIKCRRVKKAPLLDDTFIQMEEYLWNF